jgi:hypothetical protein
MLVKLLGVIDFIIGLILIFGTGIKIHYLILIFFGIIFIIKSFFGGIPKDLGSLTDLSAGIVLILMIFFTIPWFIGIILGILLFQKGIFSII